MTKRASIPRLPLLPESVCRRQVFSNMEVAKKTAFFLLPQGLRLRPYKCGLCKRIHLTGWG
jgi:hypothetical protein